MSNFSIWVKKNLFGSGQKVPGSKAGLPLICSGSKVTSGQGPSLLQPLSFGLFKKLSRSKVKIMNQQGYSEERENLSTVELDFPCFKCSISFSQKVVVDVYLRFANRICNGMDGWSRRDAFVMVKSKTSRRIKTSFQTFGLLLS